MLGIISGIVTAAVSVVKSLTVVGLAIQGLKTLGNALMGIAKALGLIKPETKVEELGDKALQAEEAGVTPDKFDSYQAYVKAVENEEGYSYNPEKTKDVAEEVKVQKGIELSAGVTMERFPDMPIAEFYEFAGKYEKMNPGFFTESKLSELGKLMEKNENYVSEVLGYMNGTELDDATNDRAIDTIISLEKAENPNISDQEALKNALVARK